MLLLAGVFGTLARAAAIGAWAPALPILLVLGALAMAIAHTGPPRQVVAD